MAGRKDTDRGAGKPGHGPGSDFPGDGISFHVDVQYGHRGHDAAAGDRPAGPHSEREKSRPRLPFAVLGVAYSASIGGMGTLVGSPPNAIAAHELAMGFAEWFRIAMPIVAVFGVLVFSLMYLFFKPNLKLHVDMAPATDEERPSGLDGKQIRVLILFAVIAGCWMGSGFLSSLLGGIPSMDTLIALCAVVLLPLCGVINWSGIAKNTDWGVLLLFGGGITLSTVLVQTDAAKFLANQVSDLAMGQNPLIILLIISVFITSLTEFCSNTASAALVAPLMVTVVSAWECPPRRWCFW